MYKKVACLTITAISLTININAQTTYLQLGQEDYHLFDRIETRSGTLSEDLFLTIKPLARKGAVSFLQQQRKEAGLTGLSSIDRYNISHAMSVSGEWAPEADGAIDSKNPVFNTFYKKQPDLLHVNTDDFFLSLNPIVTAQGLVESNSLYSSRKAFTSSRGLEARGWIAQKVGFYTSFTDNQETVPYHVQGWADSNDAVPGADFYTINGQGKYDYLQARGYIDFAAVKNHINVTFGYDKNFVGDGIRSLFLSDFAAATPFLRLNTRIWKLNYQNLYMELTPQYRRGSDRRLPHKYATMHHLSVNATRWLNIGIFEGVIFDRRDRYEFSYMIPIILYRQVERSLGSPDNVVLGLNFKAIAAKHIQLYGQLLLDEFTSKQLVAGNGYWANKFGIQLGGKYFDAAGIKNLDLQGEINLVRPFTYSHFDSTANYTHYNQPLAHPLGAGFAEILGAIHYQPMKNLYLTVKGMYYTKGADTGSSNFGGNIFKDYDTRSMDFGVGLINGVKTKCASLNLNASYEFRENLFVDLGLTHREYAYENAMYPAAKTTYVYFGFRLNLAKRSYEFF